MGATSTTDLEPLSDHGAPPQVRRIAAAHVAPPRASRHFSARQTRVNVGFLNPVSHVCTLRYPVPTNVPLGGGYDSVEPGWFTFCKYKNA